MPELLGTDEYGFCPKYEGKEALRGLKKGKEQIRSDLGFIRAVLLLRVEEPEAKEGWRSRPTH